MQPLIVGTISLSTLTPMLTRSAGWKVNFPAISAEWQTEGCNHLPLKLTRVEVNLPVRLDIVGGWSDTPPWSLERTGCVLNMAVKLEEQLPLGAEISVHNFGSGISMSDDAGHTCNIKDPRAISPPFQADDPFRLVKAALIVTGFGGPNSGSLSHELRIRTWANVARGSGLGVSSILAAAVVRGLLQLQGVDESPKIVANLVLVLEQIMGTGGGWQDQIGGVYPGIKLTTSSPGPQITLKVDPIEVSSELKLALQDRMVVIFTGQVLISSSMLLLLNNLLTTNSTVNIACRRSLRCPQNYQDSCYNGICILEFLLQWISHVCLV